ncbi:MAG TPA: monovalent cation/H+ antiporter subunit D family protein [Thermodesulfobacteriota bacterium]|nr:monovalent cation/H+ antiporter subunit D family protein [Thermodesulfobacteriota bacterium]
MEVVSSTRPLWAVLISGIAAILILLTGEDKKNLREFWTLLASILKFLVVVSMIPTVLSGKVMEYTLLTLSPGIALQWRVDAFGLLFATLASALWIATSFYSIGYMRGLQEHKQTRFYFCFALALHGALGVAFASNLLTLFIFYEILTISTFPLVAHKETAEAIAGGRKYLSYLLTSATLILFSIGLTYSLTGKLDFVPGGFLANSGSTNILCLLFITFILGFGTKAALMPLHEWLPTAMVAPTPVSALLHAVAVVKAGVFCVLRVLLYVFGPNLLSDLHLWIYLAYFASITILASGMLALAQENLKRRLAFSTINNLALIILGATLLSPSAMTGGIFHIAGHGFMKIALFFVAGIIYVRTHKENVTELDGIGREMPMTMGAFALGAIGIAGIPPLVGFISKWYLGLGCLEAHEVVFLFVVVLNALLDVAYFFPIVYRSFFKAVKEPVQFSLREGSAFMVIPTVLCAIISLCLGLFPNAIVRFFEMALFATKQILSLG